MSNDSSGLSYLRTLAFFVGLFYLLLEATLSYHVWLINDYNINYYEANSSAITYSPISGYSVPQEKFRYYRSSYGVLEYTGEFRGNNWGYVDSRDFLPRSETPGKIRVAIFGDSFTNSTFLRHPWPRELERLSQSAGIPIYTMNFGMDGASVLSWRQLIIEKMTKLREYDADLYIFATTESSIRSAYVYAFTDNDKVVFGTISQSFGSAINIPETLPEKHDRWSASRILDKEQFNAGLRSARRAKEFKLVLASLLSQPRIRIPQFLEALKDKFSRNEKEVTKYTLSKALQDFLFPIRIHMDQNEIDSVVLFTPIKTSSYENLNNVLLLQGPYLFAELIGAEFHDGRQAFVNTPPHLFSQYWFNQDAHWKQTGSDHFASYVFDVLKPKLQDLQSKIQRRGN